MKGIITACTCFMLLFAGFSAQAQDKQGDDTISVERVKDIISVLAADSLKGRGLLNGGADMAADYIIKAFNKLGLEQAPGRDSYRQDFQFKRALYTSYHARLDSEMVTVPDIIVASRKLSLDWNENTPNVKVIFIGLKDDIRRKLEYVNRLKSDKLVIMDRALRPVFNQIGAGVQREKYYIDSVYQPGDKFSTVFLLTDTYKFNSFEVKAQSRTEVVPAHNIIAMLPGKSRANEYVLLSSHYDGLGYIPADKGDTIANGADDGGSSTTALLTLAEYYKQKGDNERSILFVAFSAQKASGVGSEYFARSLQTGKGMSPDQIVAGINIDVIGKVSQFGPKSAYITGYKASDLPNMLRDYAPDKFKFRPDPYRDANLFKQSDNYPLAKLGIPAHTVSTFQLGADPYYNGARDDIHTILAYIDNLTSIINAIAVSSEPIVSAKNTPTRIDPGDLK